MDRSLSRRGFLAGAAALGLAACSGGAKTAASAGSASSTPSASSSGSATATPSASSSGSASSTPSASSVPSASPAGATTTTVHAGPATFVATGPAGVQRVALTFHTSGDPAKFRALTDVLSQRKTVMTAFVVGQWLDANLDLGRQLLASGHELANHTYTHPTFADLTATDMSDEIARCRAAIAQVAPDGGRLFRPSGTADGTSTPPDAVLAAAGDDGYATVLGFDVDPLDYQDPGADAIVRRTVAALHPGAIISLHFDHSGTIEALPRILDVLQEQGLTAVTASQLLQG